MRYALWADRTRIKNSLGHSPYHLVYGLDLVVPMNLKIPTLKFIEEYLGFENKEEARLTQLLKLDEKRYKVIECMNKHHVTMKRWFDKSVKVKAFYLADIVLYHEKSQDKKGVFKKFSPIWLGPYQISKIIGDNAFRLSTLQGKPLAFPVNGQFLKYYF